MKVSLNVIRQYIDFELPPIDELVAKINAQLGGVEEVIYLGEKYKDVTIVKVVECEKHPNADKLSVCKIDAGTGELIQVVCGAPNVHAGMWAAWLPPKSVVPASFDDAEPFVLGSRELRGEMSNGMLASARELGIGDDHDGIVEILESDAPKGNNLEVGADFAEIFGLDDYVIDIENKMFTHRPDLFGQLGVAREIAGIFGEQFTSPEWYKTMPEFSDGSGELSLEVFNEAPEKSPRFMAVALNNIEVKQSPLWLKCALIAMGGKPINNIVDATNYIMLITAQPTHAYDYDKIRGGRLGVRMAKHGETITLLNDKTYELTSDDIVIADNEGAIGLAGIMGGGNSEVSPETKSIVLEVANFDMYAVRKSSMRYGLFTDALTRFNKGQSLFQNAYVLNMLMKLTGGMQASEVFDEGNYNDDCTFVSGENISELHASSPHGITTKFINDRLGLALNDQDIERLLTNVEFMVKVDEKGLGIHEPFWRTDIDEPEDIVEEVGRLYGYDRLSLELPLRSAKPTPANAQRELESTLRQVLMRAGANEVLTYSFVHERVLQAANQNKDDAYGLSNALSPDLQYYRLSLTPSLLDKVHPNIKAGHDEFAIFEIGKGHGKSFGTDEDSLPVESEQLAFVYASRHTGEGAAYYRAKVFLEFLASQCGLELAYEPLGGESTSPTVLPFEPKRSAIVTDKTSRLYIGVIGEYKKAVTVNFKLPEYTAGFELDRKAILDLISDVETSYRPLSRYPSVDRDISLKVGASLSYAKVHEALEAALKTGELDTTIEPVSIYRPDDSDTKNVAFHITLTSHDKTLTSDEVNEVIARSVEQLEASIGAEVV